MSICYSGIHSSKKYHPQPQCIDDSPPVVTDTLGLYWVIFRKQTLRTEAMIFNAGDHYLITQCAVSLACLYSCLEDWIMNTIIAVGNLTRQSETSPQLWILVE